MALNYRYDKKGKVIGIGWGKGKNYGGNMGFDQNFGAGRITNVRPKKGFKLKDVTGY